MEKWEKVKQGAELVCETAYVDSNGGSRDWTQGKDVWGLSLVLWAVRQKMEKAGLHRAFPGSGVRADCHISAPIWNIATHRGFRQRPLSHPIRGCWFFKIIQLSYETAWVSDQGEFFFRLTLQYTQQVRARSYTGTQGFSLFYPVYIYSAPSPVSEAMPFGR